MGHTSYGTVTYESVTTTSLAARITLIRALLREQKMIDSPTKARSKQVTATAAFFDLDRTLIRGSANFPLAIAAFKAGYVPPIQLLRDFVSAIIFMTRGASDERSDALRKRILDAVAGHPVKDVIDLGASFIPTLANSVLPEARIELDQCAASGVDRIIVSASPIEIVSALADYLELEGAVGTRSEIEDGKYTGRLDGAFCYGVGKVEHLTRLAKERGYDLGQCTAYSDSISDLPFLEAVGIAIAVNPDRELRVVALERGWRIIEVK